MKRNWKQDDRVTVLFDGEPYAGSIVKVGRTKAKVLFDDGDVLDILLRNMKPEATRSSRKVKGFCQYKVEWDKTKVNFKLLAEGGQFYGWWRKSQAEGSSIVYAVDIMVEYEGERYNVDTIHYYEEDPRGKLSSLNADICAAVNQWLYHKCQGNFSTIEELQQRAQKPVLHINHLETLDRIILKLKEYRDTAIRSGGLRVMILEGDNSEDPSVRIQMDLTTQALALKGKVPSLQEGVILDAVAADRSKKAKGRGKSLEMVPDDKNVKDLVKRLKASNDPKEKRKIRAILRKMGHKGGARSVK